ncbi:predicted protein [Nematostella vectensis]|uniref:Suppressor of cytokine signaling 2 n=1 Tax=Nematostella vectensis TaxID=45351 RepID=A7RUJ8_NEMVE|nr:predicted protein [Nematostella vectensis]|eukprot:XP_001636929.1 predicted protein [Nematostella vectensis]
MLPSPTVNRAHWDKSTVVGPVLDTLRQSGFYWRGITKEQADIILRSCDMGAFIIRDSSSPNFLFTLSVRTVFGVTNIRIAMDRGRFSLESIDNENSEGPSFKCVVHLIYYYVKNSRHSERHLEDNYLRREPTKYKLYLGRPIYGAVSSLQHLCRRSINKQMRPNGVYALPIPAKLKIYISNYQYPI